MSPLRKDLFQLYLKALLNQNYSNWKALVLSEEEKTDGNIHFIQCPENIVTKVQKLIFAGQYIRTNNIKADYLIRIDDDDIISSKALCSANKESFDCYADRFHTFFDIQSGNIAQQKRDWLANTVIHKFEFALSPFGKELHPLFVYDHSQTWKEFYKNKNIVYTSPDNPIYMRILSPSSITANESITGHSSSQYKIYLKKFGRWKSLNKLNGLDGYYYDLFDIRDRYFGRPLKRSFLKRLFSGLCLFL